MTPALVLRSIVLQPTTVCNLNCSYCYLPDRKSMQLMSARLTARLATEIVERGERVSITWHGGEPLACGVSHFESLIAPLAGNGCENLVTHGLQTNGTLINKDWCQLFRRYRIRVGVSVDGPANLNQNRVDWNGQASFPQMRRGLELLRTENIPYSIIAVVDRQALAKAKAIYGFFADLGCIVLGINIEEQENSNTRAVPDDEAVTRFWESLFEAWSERPSVVVREFSTKIQWLLDNYGETETVPFRKLDIFPTIAFNGDIVLLSPELLGAKEPQYANFVVGNIFHDSLAAILEKAHFCAYVKDYLQGVARCRTSCQYFGCCGGGQASNKYFELNDIGGTETAFCRNMTQRVARAILSSC